jgi:predicted dehydrogenase/threonine dehydrogenase-like Zn-dependent dehydrogenase
MKALLEDLRSGELRIVDVPSPELRPGGMLVQTHFSAISSGTELAKLEAGDKSLLGKALARPDLVRQVLNIARLDGIKTAFQKVQARLDSLSPLGYSCSGVVLSASHETGLQPGDRVACAGAGHANHCEVNFIPRNLMARVPANVSLEAACLTTIGAVAMQGLRQAQITFGETVAVIGAGLVGVLTIQLARAAGCRVVALDTNPSRAEFAKLMGAELALIPGHPRNSAIIEAFTGRGVDVAIITASTPSTEPIEMAADLVRDRGRVVVVGDVGLGVSRRKAYAKELSITLSRSYGPGRYDPQYEEKGVDYPIGYVRWTEQRNMEAFLNFLASRAIDVSPLLKARYALQDAQKAYAHLREGGAYTAILEYPVASDSPPEVVDSRRETLATAIRSGHAGLRSRKSLAVSCIGAGGFARDVIIPYLAKAEEVTLESVATSSGITAESTRRRFGFRRAQTPAEVMQDPSTDAVFVLSRHDSHAGYVVEALRNHKPVFVEKPLAVDREQLRAIKSTFSAALDGGTVPFVMVGFNRRFAAFSTRMAEFFANRREPMLVHIRVNAGYLPAEHWTHENGGRIVGELCHFVDWARFLVNMPIERVQAAALPDGSRYHHDNVNATLHFSDGSLANLLYLANGDKAVAKEYFEVFCEGSVARLEDFRLLALTRCGKSEQFKSKRDKGHHRQLELTLSSIRSKGSAPIPFEDLVEVTETTFAIHEAIAGANMATPEVAEVALATRSTSEPVNHSSSDS